MANQLLSALGRLFTSFLQLHGFTLGVEDILVRPEVRERVGGAWIVPLTLQVDEQRKGFMQGLRGCGQEAAGEAFSLPGSASGEEVRRRYEAVHLSPDSTGVRNLDFCYSRTTSKYNNLINTWVWSRGWGVSYAVRFVQSLCAWWSAQAVPGQQPAADGAVRSQGQLRECPSLSLPLPHWLVTGR